MDQKRFRCFRYAEPLTAENCGSAQYMLLDRFYRSAIPNSKPTITLATWLIEQEENYEVKSVVGPYPTNLSWWLGWFGGLGNFPPTSILASL